MFSNDEAVLKWLINYHYVDDLVAGSQDEKERDRIQAGIQHVLDQAALQNCPWVKIQHPLKEPAPGPPSADELKQLIKIFGMSYLKERDCFILSVSVNLHKFERGRPVGPGLQPGEDVEAYVSQFNVTKRLLARICMAC